MATIYVHPDTVEVVHWDRNYTRRYHIDAKEGEIQVTYFLTEKLAREIMDGLAAALPPDVRLAEVTAREVQPEASALGKVADWITGHK